MRVSRSASRAKRYSLCVFFFQAEDGIRDLTVTGVQTCALPISELWVRFARPLVAGQARSLRVVYHGDLITYGSLMEQIERRRTDSLPRRWRDSLRRALPPAMDRWFFLKSANLSLPRYAAPTYGSC